MADWDYGQQPEEQTQGQKKEKKRSGVTRKEFYACFVILLAVILWRTGALGQSVQRQENNAEYILQRIDDVSMQMYQISDEVAAGVEKANSPLGECYYEVADIDLQAKTALLRFSAQPKEYRPSMTSMRFFLTCDDGEAITIEAIAGEDHSFTAEKEIPLCDTALARAALQLGDTEYFADMGYLNLGGYAYPDFSAYFGGSYTWTDDGAVTDVSGRIQVDVTPGEWMLNQNEALELHDPTAEIYLDGELLQSIPMQAEAEEGYYSSYTCETEGGFRMEEGQKLEIYFKAEDANGLKYSYLIERTHIADYDILSEEPENGRLTVE